MRHAFTLEYWRDEDWFVGRLREVPGVFSQGETIEALETNIRGAYEMIMADSTAPPILAPMSTKPIEVEV